MKLYIKNKLTLSISVILLLLGIILLFSQNNIFVNIGTSLIASSIVSFVTQLFLESRDNSLIDEWKIEKIYERRSEKNKESDVLLPLLKHNLDGIAFGLRKWRSNNKTEIQNALNRGVNIRLIIMNPNSKFVSQRSKEENQNENMKNSLTDLINFAEELNEKSVNGKIEIKGYDCMTLDFYWRMDDSIYVGPYLYGKSSSDTITYKFKKRGKGYEYYFEYFEKLWNDDSLIYLVSKNSNK